MSQHKIPILCVIVLAALVTMFPPWIVQERATPLLPWSPPFAAGSSFIFSPPTVRYADSAFMLRTAELDGRGLMLRYLLVILAGVGGIVARRLWLERQSRRATANSGPALNISSADTP